MWKFATGIAIGACFCVVLVLAAAGANAKGGSPGFHSLLHRETAPFAARPSRQCGAVAWMQRHRFVRMTCLSAVHHARYFALR